MAFYVTSGILRYFWHFTLLLAFYVTSGFLIKMDASKLYETWDAVIQFFYAILTCQSRIHNATTGIRAAFLPVDSFAEDSESFDLYNIVQPIIELLVHIVGLRKKLSFPDFFNSPSFIFRDAPAAWIEETIFISNEDLSELIHLQFRLYIVDVPDLSQVLQYATQTALKATLQFEINPTDVLVQLQETGRDFVNCKIRFTESLWESHLQNLYSSRTLQVLFDSMENEIQNTLGDFNIKIFPNQTDLTFRFLWLVFGLYKTVSFGATVFFEHNLWHFIYRVYTLGYFFMLFGPAAAKSLIPIRQSANVTSADICSMTSISSLAYKMFTFGNITGTVIHMIGVCWFYYHDNSDWTLALIFVTFLQFIGALGGALTIHNLFGFRAEHHLHFASLWLGGVIVGCTSFHLRMYYVHVIEWESVITVCVAFSLVSFFLFIFIIKLFPLSINNASEWVAVELMRALTFSGPFLLLKPRISGVAFALFSICGLYSLTHQAALPLKRHFE